jgi:hypothetical protein
MLALLPCYHLIPIRDWGKVFVLGALAFRVLWGQITDHCLITLRVRNGRVKVDRLLLKTMPTNRQRRRYRATQTALIHDNALRTTRSTQYAPVTPYGRGGVVGRLLGVGRVLGVGVGLGVEVGVGVGVAVAVGVGVGLGALAGAWIATVMGDPVLKKPTVALALWGG